MRKNVLIAVYNRLVAQIGTRHYEYVIIMQKQAVHRRICQHHTQIRIMRCYLLRQIVLF